MTKRAPRRTIDGSTRLVALLGDPVAHSLSPAIMNAAFEACGLNWVYIALPVPAPGLGTVVRALAASGAAGANVTSPHKRRAAVCSDRLSAEVRRTGSANTLSFGGKGVRADATDGAGFIRFLRAERVPFEGRGAVVIGSGGAARSLLYHLSREGAEVGVISRRPEAARRALLPVLPRGTPCAAAARGSREAEALLEAAAVLVNATPLGARAGDPMPADPSPLPRGAAVVDLLYAPRATPFVRAAGRRGIRAMNGLGLLVEQACLSFEIWTGLGAPRGVMLEVVSHESSRHPGRRR